MLAWLLVSSLLGLLVSTIDIRHSLSEVKLCLCAITYSFQFEQRGVRTLVVLTTLEPNKDTLCV